MGTTANNEQPGTEALELVLEEFTKEQKSTNLTIADLVTAVNSLGNKVDTLKNELDKPKPISVIADTKSIQQSIQKGITDIKIIVGSQPKNIIRKFQILLFPEQDAKLFYKVVFGRWFLMVVIALFILNVYNWSIHYTNTQKEIQIKQLENKRIREAWTYMYLNNSKNVKAMMEKAYLKSE